MNDASNHEAIKLFLLSKALFFFVFFTKYVIKQVKISQTHEKKNNANGRNGEIKWKMILTSSTPY